MLTSSQKNVLVSVITSSLGPFPLQIAMIIAVLRKRPAQPARGGGCVQEEQVRRVAVLAVVWEGPPRRDTGEASGGRRLSEAGGRPGRPGLLPPPPLRAQAGLLAGGPQVDLGLSSPLFLTLCIGTVRSVTTWSRKMAGGLGMSRPEFLGRPGVPGAIRCRPAPGRASPPSAIRPCRFDLLPV